jgi:hypothetical protein
MENSFFLLSMLSIGLISAGITIKNDTDNETNICWHYDSENKKYYTLLDPNDIIELRKKPKLIEVEKIREREESLWVAIPVSPKSLVVKISKIIDKHNKAARKGHQRRKSQ